ncbi:MAG: hypothetical protein V4628_09035 [Pseudomonadota bacterium]
MKFIAIIGMLLTILSTLTALVFCMGMGANASAAQIHALKLWITGFSLLGIAGIVISIFLLRADQTGWAVNAAFAPTIIIFIIFVISVSR